MISNIEMLLTKFRQQCNYKSSYTIIKLMRHITIRVRTLEYTYNYIYKYTRDICIVRRVLIYTLTKL